MEASVRRCPPVYIISTIRLQSEVRHSVVAYAISAVAGAYAALTLPHAPAIGALNVVVLLGLIGGACCRFRPLIWAALGFAAAGFACRDMLADRLAVGLEGREITAIFAVRDFPERRGAVARLIVRPSPAVAGLPSRIRLSWYDAEALPALGECIRLTVRLRRPRGSLNPGGFDYEGWLFRERIGASGYVRDAGPIVACRTSALSRLRAEFSDRLDKSLPADRASAVVRAVALGARQRISDADWRAYSATGTTHLMAISGLHVGLAAATVLFPAWLFATLLLPRFNSRCAAVSLAFGAAVGYALLAGLGVPARRAIVMLALGTLAVLCRRRVLPATVLAMTCLLLTFAMPLSLLSPGFKLSFAAVAVLLMLGAGARRRAAASRLDRAMMSLRDLLALQLALWFGLFPLTAALFNRAAWLAPLTNALVLPVFAVAVVPLSLAALLLPVDGFARAAAIAAHSSTAFALRVVDWTAAIPGSEMFIARLYGSAFLIACLTCVWICLPRGWPGRWLAPLAALSVVSSAPSRPPSGCVDVYLLDVGQGLAAVLVSESQVLLYDTGPTYRSGADAGRFAVLPFLRSLGVTAIDVLLVSHGDNDHAGGVVSIAEALTIRQVLVGEQLPALARPQVACRRGTSWRVDGIHFHVLHPPTGAQYHGNDASCVVEVRVGATRAVLTGDIEADAERIILGAGLLGEADLVVVPHHGSNTSSHARFVATLRPKIALVSSGYANRWNQPTPAVQRRWQDAGATLYNTAEDGAIALRMCDRDLRLISRQRHDARRLWHAR